MSSSEISHPRKSCTHKPLPNERQISNVFHKEVKPHPEDHTTHFMEWGQLVAHDLTFNDIFRKKDNNTSIKCCNKGPQLDDKCMSIPPPPHDPHYSKAGVSCITIIRTVPCRHCTGDQRVHWNQNTAYHDLSLVYGSTEEKAKSLRSNSRGMFEVEFSHETGPMLPSVSIKLNCISPPKQKSCSNAGDPRSNQTPFLLTVQTYLLRYHNYICQELSEINPHWDDEKLYQEARRINIAQVQFITYFHYLPVVLGNIMEKEDLDVLPGAKYTKYDPELDASIFDEYSAFAARYGHSIIPSSISEISPKTKEKKCIALRDWYDRPFEFKYGQYDKIAQGMTVDKRMKHDALLSEDVRNFLYRRVYLNETTADDLAAVSIARARDHGVPGYTYYVNYFFDIEIHTFDDLRERMSDKSVDLLEKLYDSVHDIDVYSAGLAENHVPGGFVGPTFGAVLGDQYRRIKFGDRYWFEHGHQAGSFTKKQLKELKEISLARILCETTKITEVQRDVFYLASKHNPIVPCKKIDKFNFHLWKA